MSPGLPDHLFRRAVTQLIHAAGPDGVEEEHLIDALGALERLAVSAGIWQTWEADRAAISWDGTELRFSSTTDEDRIARIALLDAEIADNKNTLSDLVDRAARDQR
ncbi:hypothetical protein ASC77_22240 [Nocardioides sp. Root1257]|uniref:hypothetical protein n=1 Tax=unclassified Nocardioides TaxID=2615069 RepID=UPI0007018FEC|nr:MULTISPECIES: hypothetical protein [unclassified Nocardioides]KQW43017.1 hypothetical protein ASC77_22240 [Nocardioides sp. Root1257]KRC41885.1 hypothetical protein ASE24_22030 [Nocardioides sp. Root224]